MEGRGEIGEFFEGMEKEGKRLSGGSKRQGGAEDDRRWKSRSEGVKNVK